VLCPPLGGIKKKKTGMCYKCTSPSESLAGKKTKTSMKVLESRVIGREEGQAGKHRREVEKDKYTTKSAPLLIFFTPNLLRTPLPSLIPLTLLPLHIPPPIPQRRPQTIRSRELRTRVRRLGVGCAWVGRRPVRILLSVRAVSVGGSGGGGGR
jgi:hypothetical protein